MYQAYAAVGPKPSNFPVLAAKLGELPWEGSLRGLCPKGAVGRLRNHWNRQRLSYDDHTALKKDAAVSIGPVLIRRLIRAPKGGAMKYLTFIRSAESYRNTPPPPAMMEAMGRFIEKCSKDGTLVDTGGLLPSKEGFRVRLANGKISVTDGPFSESKEVIGGWAILKADSKAEVLRVATEFMELHSTYWPEFEGESEVRPIEFAMGE